jgi:hypothetical protein
MGTYGNKFLLARAQGPLSLPPPFLCTSPLPAAFWPLFPLTSAMATPLATLVCTGLTLPDHAYTDCVYCHPEDMVLIAQQLGADAAQLVKRGILVTVNGGAGELVAFLKCVALPACLRPARAGWLRPLGRVCPALAAGCQAPTPTHPLSLSLLPPPLHTGRTTSASAAGCRQAAPRGRLAPCPWTSL